MRYFDTCGNDLTILPKRSVRQGACGEAMRPCCVTYNLTQVARAELDKAYRTITEKIDALVIVEGAKTYENFIRTWNAVVEKYANGLRRRRDGDLSRPLSEPLSEPGFTE